MSVVSRKEEMPFSPAQMYALVNNIRDYPEFLPWCSDTQIHREDEDEVHASIVISGGGFRKRFTTCNRLQKDKMIEIRLIDGPFKHLEGFWRFSPRNEDHCTVALDMEFEFAGRLLDFAFTPIFHQATNTLVDAFRARAGDVYGKQNPS